MANTQLLLLQDVDDLGRKGDVVSVTAGYAFNFLIPQSLAVIASPGALRRQAKLKEERRVIAEQDRKEAEKQVQHLEGLTLNFVVKVDHEGHMYGSVSQMDIVHEIMKLTTIQLDKRSIQLKHPIKETGVYEMPLRLKEGVLVEKIHVKVVPEQA